MKWLLSISIVLSLSLNAYLIYDDVRHSYSQELMRSVNRSMGLEVNKTKWSEGLKLFQTKLKEKNGALAGKKYYYINIWTASCKPCIREMPWLDSIAGSLKKDVGYIYLTDMTTEAASNVIKNRNFHLKNFVFLNDMNDFVSGICNERNTRNKVYPMVLILSNKGEVL